MSKSLLNASAAFTVLILAGCATYGNWTPTVDPYNDPNANRIQQDLAECRQLALHASGGTTTQTVQGGLVGGAIGAAAGAAIGAAVGGGRGAGRGAAIGAATGGFGGGVHQGMSAEQQYKYAYIRCMKYRGHNVIN
ncbi:MAG: hypothetical protein ABFS02_03300 [Pseudomonadota bacterium]